MIFCFYYDLDSLGRTVTISRRMKECSLYSLCKSYNALSVSVFREMSKTQSFY